VLRHLAGDAGQPQDEAAASYGCSRVPDDGEIDWSASTEQIYRLYRALTPPFPGAYTFLGEQRLTLGVARPVEQPPRYVGRVPGRVVAIDRASGAIDVLTGDGVLRIASFRADNGLTPAATIVTSVRATFGLRPRDLLARIAALEREIAVLRAAPIRAVDRNNGRGGVQRPIIAKRTARHSVGS
jgi:hypothetical protein